MSGRLKLTKYRGTMMAKDVDHNEVNDIHRENRRQTNSTEREGVGTDVDENIQTIRPANEGLLHKNLCFHFEVCYKYHIWPMSNFV